MPFNWYVYLAETGAELSPPHLFEHVTRGLEPLIQPGQVLEARSSNPDDFVSADMDDRWWPAEVVSTSCHLILLRWCTTFTDSTHDDPDMDRKPDFPSSPQADPNCFWFDVKGSRWDLIRPLKLDTDKSTTWVPPNHLSHLGQHFISNPETCRLWKTRLKNRLVPNFFFDHRASFIYETIRVGGYFECEHEDNPLFVWPAKVIRNTGGRIELSWFGANTKQQQANSEHISNPTSTFTLYYTHRRIHLLGWAKLHCISYYPPHGLTPTRSISNTDAFIRGAPCAASQLCGDDSGNPLIAHRKVRRGHAFYQPDPPLHEFKVGWKLEAVNPRRPCVVQPATVVQVFNSHYFLVQLDDLTQDICDHPTDLPSFSTPERTANQRVAFVSHAGAAEIMCVNTSQLRGLHLAPPSGWPSKRSFTWTNYLTYLAENDHKNYVNVDNSFLRSASANNLLKFPPNSAIALYSTTNRPDLVHSPSTDLLSVVDQSHSSDSNPTHFLYCPSEHVFKGISTTDPHSSQSNVESSHPRCSTGIRGPDHDGDNLVNHKKSLSRFLLGMKLEMTVPSHLLHLVSSPNSVSHPLCTGTVTRVDQQHLLWILPDIHLPSSSRHTPEPVMIDARSTDLYPVGWAALVGHPIIGPPGYTESDDERLRIRQQTKANPTPILWNIEMRPTHDLQYQTVSYESEEICPPIYINTKCYLGPFLCRANLDQLPRCFGPGPTPRVLHNMLTRLVSAAYKPIRVLRMFEADWASNLASAHTNLRTAERSSSRGSVGRGRFSLPNARLTMSDAESEAIEQYRSGMQLVVLRIRCPRRYIKVEAPVEVCRRARAVEEFCRQVSLLLEACPHLISTQPPYHHHPTPEPTGFHGTNLVPVSELSSKRTQLSVATVQSIMHAHNTHECPSFCVSRLRARNLDRLPGWKRRLYASLRPFGVQPPNSESSTGLSTQGPLSNTNLRTRSAVAAHQHQHYMNKAASPNHGLHGLTNGLPIGRTTRRLRGRGRVRFRGSTMRRLSTHVADSQPNSLINFPCTDPKSTQVITQNSDFSRKITTHTPNAHQPDWRVHPPGVNQHPLNHYIRQNHHRTQPNEKYMQDALMSSTPSVVLRSNPLFWSPIDLATYLDETDCREMWPWLAAEAVDGQAFMLLTLPVLHHLVGLRWEDAIRLSRHAVAVKRAFLEQFGADGPEPKVNTCIDAT